MRIFEVISSGNFILHPTLNPDNYKITPNISDEWQAMTYEANSGGRKGQMDRVRYVMISYKDNTIVPIAIADEHRTGYDLLYDLDIDGNDYISVASFGNNYIYQISQIPNWLIVLKKFVQWGGNSDNMIRGNTQPSFATTIENFLSTNGNVTTKNPDQLSFIGKRTITYFENVAKGIRTNDPKVFDLSLKMLDFIDRFGWHLVSSSKAPKLEHFENAILSLNSDLYSKSGITTDFGKLEDLIFGFNGVKNVLHNRIREVIANPKDSWAKFVSDYWGNIQLAYEILGNL